MSAKILVKKSSGSQQYDLASEVTSLGRSEDNVVMLDDAASSRHHAQIRLEGGRYVVADLGSLNGTLVNGEQVTAPRELRDGDVVTIGTTNIVFTGPTEQVTQAFVAPPRQEPVTPAQPMQPPVMTPPPQAGQRPLVAPAGPQARPGVPPAGQAPPPVPVGIGPRPGGPPAGPGPRPGAVPAQPGVRAAVAPGAGPVAPAKKSRAKMFVIIGVVAVVVLLLACAGVIALAFSQGWIYIE